MQSALENPRQISRDGISIASWIHFKFLIILDEINEQAFAFSPSCFVSEGDKMKNSFSVVSHYWNEKCSARVAFSWVIKHLIMNKKISSHILSHENCFASDFGEIDFLLFITWGNVIRRITCVIIEIIVFALHRFLPGIYAVVENQLRAFQLLSRISSNFAKKRNNNRWSTTTLFTRKHR